MVVVAMMMMLVVKGQKNQQAKKIQIEKMAWLRVIVVVAVMLFIICMIAYFNLLQLRSIVTIWSCCCSCVRGCIYTGTMLFSYFCYTIYNWH